MKPKHTKIVIFIFLFLFSPFFIQSKPDEDEYLPVKVAMLSSDTYTYNCIHFGNYPVKAIFRIRGGTGRYNVSLHSYSEVLKSNSYGFIKIGQIGFAYDLGFYIANQKYGSLSSPYPDSAIIEANYSVFFPGSYCGLFIPSSKTYMDLQINDGRMVYHFSFFVRMILLKNEGQV